jgi:hypothetical protein
MKPTPGRPSRLGLVLAGLVVLAGARASADEEAAPRGAFAPAALPGSGFGATGQIAISGDFEAHLHSGWELRLHPSLDYFIAPNISVGGLVGITYTSGIPSITTIDLGVRAGYNLNINEKVGIWPKVGIYYSHVSEHPDSSNTTTFRLDAPFLYHLAPHLFAGIGPYFSLDLNGGGNGYGLDSIVGGWF